MKFTLAGCATGVLALTAIAVAPQAAASPDDDFLKALSDAGVTFPADTAGSLIQDGHAVCQTFDSGASGPDVIGAFSQSAGLDPQQASIIVRAAAQTLCPTYLSKV